MALERSAYGNPEALTGKHEVAALGTEGFFEQVAQNMTWARIQLGDASEKRFAQKLSEAVGNQVDEYAAYEQVICADSDVKNTELTVAQLAALVRAYREAVLH